jgi:sugar transferase (PEP-CTERM/EpsH1 system associated)
MQKIKIVHVIHSFATGGMEKGIATVINHGTDRFEHTILCLTTSGDSQRLLTKCIPIIEMNKPEGNSLRFLINLSRSIRVQKPDIVHTRNWSGLDGVIAARLAGISNIVHGEHGWGMEDLDGVNFKRVLIRRLLAVWTKTFTCVSQQMAGWLTKDIHIPRNRITRIYNGIDCHQFQPASCDLKRKIRLEIGANPDHPIIGIVGRLDPVKDHQSLFEAFNLVRKDLPEAILLVVGDGPDRRRLEDLAGDGIVFLGNRLDVPTLLKALDIFVLPSLNEGISNTILEAMASALPVVATAVGGTPEIVKNGRTGLLVPPKTPSAIATAILKYLKNNQLCRQHGVWLSLLRHNHTSSNIYPQSS